MDEKDERGIKEGLGQDRDQGEVVVHTGNEREMIEGEEEEKVADEDRVEDASHDVERERERE